MFNRAWSPAPLVCLGIASVLSACGSNPKPQKSPKPAAQTAAPSPAPAQTPAPVVPPPVDPVAALITKSQDHFTAGERELKLGHLERARSEFDRAVDVLLESPYGARTDARMREHFDRLVDRINAHEVSALAQGDGFSERKTEPASIDEILAIATFPRPDAAASTEATVKADLAATAHDVPIPQHPKVLAAVELLTTRLREYVQESLTRGSQYLPMIQNVFRAEGLPLDLAYIPIIESGFKANALSKASAKGPWQFMRPTARDHGLKTDWYIDERSDPEKATVAAAKHLKMLHRMFDGDWHLVLAAYNGGQGRLQRALTKARTGNFWELAESSRYLPRETREYVPLILAAIIVGKNPSQYGIEFTPAAPAPFEKIMLPRAVDLRRVAEWTGTTIDEIQALNPELRRWTTPVRTANYEMKVPAGTADRLMTELRQASPGELGALNWYTVKRGETLATIARKLRVARVDLAEANNLATSSRVQTGQELIIPRAPATLLATRTERPAPAAVASRAISGPATVAAVERAVDERPAAERAAPDARRAQQNGPIVYRVKRGDTLSSIARLFDTTVEKIKSLNRLRGNRIAVGDRLTVKSK